MILPTTSLKPLQSVSGTCGSTTRKSSRFAYRRLQELGLEIPRLSWFDWGGFLAAWLLVGGLIGLLIWLAGLGSR